MKIIGVLLAALLIGAALGVGTSVATFRTAYGRLTEKGFFPIEDDTQTPPLTPTSATDPAATIAQDHYDFGVLENGEQGEHAFVIANDGGSPLEIELLEISCKCTSADLAKGRKVLIDPGKTYEVKLSWHANSSTGVFRQAAKMASNDPRRPEFHLVVTGKVVKGVVVDPPFFHLTGVSTGQPFEGEIHIHSYRSADFKVLKHELVGGVNPDLFEVSFNPISVDKQRYPEVLSAVSAKLKVKPGLPIGTVSQEIKIQTNDPRKPELTVAIVGIVDGPVSLSGTYWLPKLSLLKIGAFSREDGFKTTLVMKIIGVDPTLLHPKVLSKVPSNLEIKIDEARVIDSGDRVVVTYPVSIEIPPGGPVLTYLDTLQAPLGLIEIDTGHAETGVLRMNVELVTVD